jgi:hypothetical protein
VETSRGRIVGGAAAFAFADVWVVAGFTAAVGCAAAAAAGYCAVLAAERHSIASTRAKIVALRSRVETRLAPPRQPRSRRVRASDRPTAESTYGW